MARKKMRIFPLFEETRRLMDSFTDEQFGKVVRYALKRYYDSETQTDSDPLVCFAANVLLDQAARYDSFRDQQRSRALGVRASDAVDEDAQPDGSCVADGEPEASCAEIGKPNAELYAERSENTVEELQSQPGAANEGFIQPNTPPSPSPIPSPVPSPSPSPIPSPKDNSLCSDAVGLLNALSGGSFSPKTKATQRLISAREKEGYCFADFEAVIRHQCDLWGRDEKMRQYLRPETLFGTKFEAYLSNARRTLTPQEPAYILAPLEDPWEVAMRKGNS